MLKDKNLYLVNSAIAMASCFTELLDLAKLLFGSSRRKQLNFYTVR